MNAPTLVTATLWQNKAADIVNKFKANISYYAEIKHSDWLKEVTYLTWAIQSECFISAELSNATLNCVLYS